MGHLYFIHIYNLLYNNKLFIYVNNKIIFINIFYYYYFTANILFNHNVIFNSGVYTKKIT